MTKEQIKFLIGESAIPNATYRADIQQIYEIYECKHPLYLMTLAFMYGVIVSKQQERARKKGNNASEVEKK